MRYYWYDFIHLYSSTFIYTYTYIYYIFLCHFLELMGGPANFCSCTTRPFSSAASGRDQRRPATTCDDLRRPGETTALRRPTERRPRISGRSEDQRRSMKRRAPTWKNGLENGFRHDLTNSVEICGNHLLR